MLGAKQLAPEVEGRKAAMEALRAILPAADGEGAGIGLQVEIVVRIAQRGEARIEGQRLLGEEILVLDDAGRELDAGHARRPAWPRARRS